MRFFVRGLTAFAICAAVWIIAIGQAPAPSVPFFTTPSTPAFSFSSGVILLVRQPDNVYAQLRAALSPPYGLLSSIDSLTRIISGSIKYSFATPAGPTNVGLASQIIALGNFVGDNSPGVAYADPLRRYGPGLVVYLSTPSFVFRSTNTYNVGPEPAGVIAGDFNRDGKTDLAVAFEGNRANNTPGGVAILLNKGDGTFAPAAIYTAGIAPASLATFDLNHDGFLDLAVADVASSPGAVFVLLGKGDGTFGPATGYPAGRNPFSVTIADFNGDGNPDLAVTASDRSATVLLGNGNGTFRPGTSFATGNFAQYIAAGDINQDGKMDLVISNSSDQTISIFLGKGDGTFQLRSTYVTSYLPSSLVLTDYNVDGNLDIIAGLGDARGFGASFDSGNIDLLIGNGDGTFRGAVTASAGANGGTFLATADFNGDGKLDAIINDQFGGNLYFFAGAGNGAFQQPVTLFALNGSGPHGAAVGDFNGDGKPDLAVSDSFANNISIFLNSVAGLQQPSTFSSGGNSPTGIVAADFDGDGKLDLAVLNSPPAPPVGTSNLAVFFGGGNGAFQLNNTYAAGNHPAGLAVVDLNGDGKPDLIVTDDGVQGTPTPTPGAVYVFLNDGKGALRAPGKYSASDYPSIVTVGDVNGDGKPDLVVGTGDVHIQFHLAVFLGNGDGTFQPARLLGTDFGPSSIAIRDFNGDGKADLVVADCCGATDMTFLAGNGDGTFQPEVHFNGGASPYAVTAADLNADGKPDLVIAGNQTGSITALLNNGVPPPAAIVNGASFASGGIVPGEIATIFGTNLTSSIGINMTSSLPLPTTFLNVSVIINGSKAPLFAVDNVNGQQQINLQVPWEVAGLATASITVSNDGAMSSAITVPVLTSQPGIFTYVAGGKTFGAILHANFQLVDTAHPAVAGETVLIYCTGLGAVVSPPADAAPGNGQPTKVTPTVTIGGVKATVSFSGLAPGFVGLYQMNAIVPVGSTSGNQPVVITMSGSSSNSALLPIH